MTKRWQGPARELAMCTVRVDHAFQLRAKGIDPVWAGRLRKALEAGEELPPVKVAEIGKALYLVDGFHRHHAHAALGRSTIPAKVARLSVAGAKEEARLANTTHGKGLSRADKARVWNDYLANGRHLGKHGQLKPCRVIERELGWGVYTHETIRQKLKARGHELDNPAEYPSGYKPQRRDDEGALEAERVEEAEGCLRAFGELFPTLPIGDRRALLGAARALLGTLEGAEGPGGLEGPPGALLDI